jgi:hypothetical protein
MEYRFVTGKSAGCPAFLPIGRGGGGSRPYDSRICITRKPPPCLSRLNGMGGELHFPVGLHWFRKTRYPLG